jgi:hypothetical protein
MDRKTGEMGRTVFIVLVTLVLAGAVIPLSSASLSPDTPRGTPFVTYPDLTGMNGSLANHTPSGYPVTPTLLTVKVELPDTALPVSKGEMAAGPRAIGFSMDPVTLAIAILVIAIVAAGTGYYLRQKRDEEKRE